MTLHLGDIVFIHWKCAPAGLAKVVEIYDAEHVMLESPDEDLTVVEEHRCIPVYTHDTRKESLRIWNAWTAVLFAGRLWSGPPYTPHGDADTLPRH